MKTALAFILAVLLNFTNVVGRYLFGISLLGSDELQVFIILGVTFLGAAVVTRRNHHLRMDVLVQFMPASLRLALRVIEQLLLIVLAGFVISQPFNRQPDVDQYARFMDDVVALVVERHDGALKAEHGTGRNMAPFVEAEWGADALAIMRRLKALVDPDGLLNPGVILNDDPRAHLADLKPLPIVEAEVDKCIECGYCLSRTGGSAASGGMGIDAIRRKAVSCHCPLGQHGAWIGHRVDRRRGHAAGGRYHRCHREPPAVKRRKTPVVVLDANRRRSYTPRLSLTSSAL